MALDNKKLREANDLCRQEKRDQMNNFGSILS